YWMYNSLWQIHYRDIVNMNNAMDQILQYREFADPSDYDLADQYVAETKVLRGWLHFNLARVWGDVFIIETAQPTKEIEKGV
ncbi:RagB/SusD family nutrient uptake outer membrane protein, partial [Psychroserpens mesophilus]